jgi:hypothetical protein
LPTLELPDLALALAVAGLVLKEQDVVLGGCCAGTTIVVPVFTLVVDWQHRHGGDLRVGREKGPDMHHSTERDVP